MNKLVDSLLKAQEFAISVRPVVGGFPVLAEVLRQAGVRSNRWTLPSCQSVYIFQEGAVVQQGEPLVRGSREVPSFNRDLLIAAIRTDQNGKSTFPEFLKSAWEAGVIGYEANFVERKVTYVGVNGDSYVESYPEVDVPNAR